jgi:dTDP-4-dehydrorhamnose 3,5-epimerase
MAAPSLIAKLQVFAAELPGLMLIQPKVFRDARGFFLESYNEAAIAELGISAMFKQDNHSRSQRGVLRGLHYQVSPHEQGKLVRVIRGEIFDVAVDIRRGSPTLGQWFGTRLNDENLFMMWIPAGFAHGFLVLSDVADVLYKTTDYYAAQCERTIAWNDPDLAIQWPLSTAPLLSHKDQLGEKFADTEFFDR